MYVISSCAKLLPYVSNTTSKHTIKNNGSIKNSLKNLNTKKCCIIRQYSVQVDFNENNETKSCEKLEFNGNVYKTDEWTNITPKIQKALGRNLYKQSDHPLCIVKNIIVDHFYKTYTKPRGAPVFTVLEDLPQVVTTEENFDNLLVPIDHVSRQKSDNYYINKNTLLRAHTTAHEVGLIKSGFNAFLTIGDVYRRDTIDSTHYPVFHQLEGVRLFNEHQIFESLGQNDDKELKIFENTEKTNDKQACHTLAASKLVEFSLKQVIEDCMKCLFGKDMEYRWVDAYFPFTHPSFELEIKYKGDWVEMLGCGVLEQEILNNAGAGNKIGWAFGIGLERLAMKLFSIPDIRYFWSQAPAVLSQFKQAMNRDFTFKIISKQPPLVHDMAFWIPENFTSNDFYDLIRDFDSDIIESVELIDEFTNKKTNKTSHCYRIFFRHVSKSLTHDEVNVIHEKIKELSVNNLGVIGRW